MVVGVCRRWRLLSCILVTGNSTLSLVRQSPSAFVDLLSSLLSLHSLLSCTPLLLAFFPFCLVVPCLSCSLLLSLMWFLVSSLCWCISLLVHLSAGASVCLMSDDAALGWCCLYWLLLCSGMWFCKQPESGKGGGFSRPSTYVYFDVKVWERRSYVDSNNNLEQSFLEEDAFRVRWEKLLKGTQWQIPFHHQNTTDYLVKVISAIQFMKN